MTSSLVGSEMCIRDSDTTVAEEPAEDETWTQHDVGHSLQLLRSHNETVCLLYTSDAADDM
eukprot:5695482-Prorocentrum_lima.AAC.1